MLHDINNALKMDEDEDDWRDLEGDMFSHMPNKQTYNGGLSPSSPLTKFVHNVDRHDRDKKGALQKQRYVSICFFVFHHFTRALFP